MLGPARLARNEDIDLRRSHDAGAVAVAAAAAIVEGGDARSGPRGRFVNCSGR